MASDPLADWGRWSRPRRAARPRPGEDVESSPEPAWDEAARLASAALVLAVIAVCLAGLILEPRTPEEEARGRHAAEFRRRAAEDPGRADEIAAQQERKLEQELQAARARPPR